MTKRNFKSPGLQHKNKWSDNFHEFLRYALQKEPKKRPSAQELLKVWREREREREREMEKKIVEGWRLNVLSFLYSGLNLFCCSMTL